MGLTVAEQNYDAWGRERNPAFWDYDMTGTFAKPTWLYRGYTGHEMLPAYGLINMNGRMYDPANGRMLRPDNYVQDPLNTQGYNRDSYCWNNPLKYTDPSGDVVFALPYVTINRRGVDVGVTAGVGAPGVLSAQVTVGTGTSGNSCASIGGTVSGISGSVGWGTQSGVFASVGAGVGIAAVPGLSTNLFSASLGWSQRGGLYASAGGVTISKDGSVSFSPSVSYSGEPFVYDYSTKHEGGDEVYLKEVVVYSKSTQTQNHSWMNNVNDYYSAATLVPIMSISFVNETKYGRWASMGGGGFSFAPYRMQKQLIQQAAASGEYASIGGKIIGVGGAALTLTSDAIGVYEGIRTGGNSPNSVSPLQLGADAAASYIGIYGGWYGGIASTAYFLASPLIWANYNIGQRSYEVPRIDNLRVSH